MSSPRRTRRGARAAVAAAAWLVASLALASVVRAAAGDGTAGFGGGGGGGADGFDVGGGGGGTDNPVVVAIVFVVVLLLVVMPLVRAARVRRRYRERERRVELAAAVAADDDPAFAPAAVRAAAEELFRAAQAAWAARDHATLGRLLVPDLYVEWERRLRDFEAKGWHNHVEVLAVDRIEYLALTNREGFRHDRVTVRIVATLRDYVRTRDGKVISRDGTSAQQVQLAEFWTLARRPGGWVVASIQSDAEGHHVLGEAIVHSPWTDEARMADESLLEVAALDRLPDHVATAEVADLDYAGDARTAALDLSLVDGRWAPDALEAALRQAVAAWAEAVDGADDDLLDVATADAARDLLHPGDPTRRTRLVIRGPRVRRLRIVALDPAAEPPTMTVEVEVSGRRYVEDRDTAAVLRGSRERETTATERWTLALAGPDERPWRIVDAAAGDVTA